MYCCYIALDIFWIYFDPTDSVVDINFNQRVANIFAGLKTLLLPLIYLRLKLIKIKDITMTSQHDQIIEYYQKLDKQSLRKDEKIIHILFHIVRSISYLF